MAYVTDSGNNLVKRFTYDSTGAMDVSEINPFVYKGYWYDWDTGLYYLNARYYSPGIGRFLSEDPAAATPGNALSYNEYAYAGNDPVNRVDPSGEFSWRAVFRWVGDLLAQAPPEIPALEILDEMGFGLKGLSEIGETAAEGTG